MSIKMTREEYRKKYGEYPVVKQTSNGDGVIKMTREEYINTYGVDPTTGVAVEKKDGFLREVAKEAVRLPIRATKTVGGIVGGLTGLATGGFAKLTGNKELEQKALAVSREALSPTPQEYKIPIIGTVKDVVPFGYSRKGEELKGVPLAKDIIGAGAEGASYAIGAPALKGATKVIGRGVLKSAGNIIKSLGKEFVRLAPTEAVSGALGGTGYSAQRQEGLKDIAKSALTGAIAGSVLSPVLTTSGSVINDVLTGTKDVLKSIPKVVSKAENKLFEQQRSLLLDTNKKIQMAGGKFSKADDAVKKSLEFEPITTQINDNTKKDTSILYNPDKGGKAPAYYENLNDVLSDSLERSKARYNLEDLRKEALSKIRNESKYQGTDYKSKANKINDEFDAYEESLLAQNRDDIIYQISPSGKMARFDVPITDVQNMKKGMWQQLKNSFNRQDSDIIQSAFYSIGESAQGAIERSVKDIDVSAINKEIGIMAEMMRLAKSADGKIISGGKLGRLFGRTLGAILGTKGGIFGQLIGMKVGDLAVRLSNDPKLRRTFVEGLLNLIKNKTDKEVGKRMISEIEAKFGMKIDEIISLPVTEKPLLLKGTVSNTPSGKITMADILGGKGNTVDLRRKQTIPSGKPINDIQKGISPNVNLKFNQENMFGMVAGFEPEYDEQGNVIGVKFDPKKAMLGVALMSGAKNIKESGILNKVAGKADDLLSEARKYKSAEEFVKAQGNPILHGTNKKFKEFDITKRGMNEKDIPARESFFFTDSLDTAKSYGKNIQERYGNFKKPLTLDADGKMYGDMREELREAVLKAKKEGNDVVIVKNLSDRKDWGNYELATHYAVIDTNSLLTKSQLTDIWNKAQESITNSLNKIE